VELCGTTDHRKFCDSQSMTRAATARFVRLTDTSPLPGSPQDALMSPIDRPRLLTSISEVLRRASVPVPTWHLAPRARWVMLRDTLLGHAPIRGGLRPRDLPFDPDAREAIHMAADVHGLTPYEVRAAIPPEVGVSPLQPEGKPGTIAFRDWIVCYSAIVEHRLGREPDSHDRVCRQAVYDCIRELRRAMVAGESDKAVPTEYPIEHRMLGLLGLSQQEWTRLQGTTRDRDVARLGALLGGCDPSNIRVASLSEVDKQHLGVLQTTRFRLITIKTAKVQDYLARGTHHWLMRGASTWCAQALALARDLMLSDDSHAGGMFLVSDCDAIVSLLAPQGISPQDLADSLQKRVSAFWGDEIRGAAESDSRFPRLAKWRAKALSAGVPPSSVMPDIVFACSEPVSLAELCSPRTTSGLPEPYRRIMQWRQDGLGDPPCAYVENDRALLPIETPEWLQERGPTSAVAMGWTSLVWSLCGSTFRTHAHEGLTATLRSKELPLSPVHQGEWLQQLGMPSEPLVYVKIDGDRIGDQFRSARLSQLPGHSLSLTRAVFRRFRRAVKKLLEETPGHQSAGLPIDLVYLGGDDLLCCVPRKLLPHLLKAFGRPLRSVPVWSNVLFTFVAIEMPPKDALTREQLLKMSLAATRSVGPALEFAKTITKGDWQQTAEKKAALADALNTAGADLTCVGQLEQFGCVRGVRVGISPLTERID
jgi:hypothetical protein